MLIVTRLISIVGLVEINCFPVDQIGQRLASEPQHVNDVLIGRVAVLDNNSSPKWIKQTGRRVTIMGYVADGNVVSICIVAVPVINSLVSGSVHGHSAA